MAVELKARIILLLLNGSGLDAVKLWYHEIEALHQQSKYLCRLSAQIKRLIIIRSLKFL